MNPTAESRTNVTLLERLAQSGGVDQAAWQEFVEQYGRMVYQWCRGRGLQEADARDVTQRVLLKISQHMKRFVYDPARSFRAWLRTVVRNALIDFLTDQHPDRATGDSNVQEQLHSIEARNDLEQQIERTYDLELLNVAFVRVRLRVAPHTWDAFALTSLEGVPTADVAVRLRMKIASVYQARLNVIRMLQRERESLEHAQESDRKPTDGRTSA
jgi:RNA polymerase sigma-70 factor (ECF subfamily)